MIGTCPAFVSKSLNQRSRQTLQTRAARICGTRDRHTAWLLKSRTQKEIHHTQYLLNILIGWTINSLD